MNPDFYVIYRFCFKAEDFVLIGVFTSSEDAEAFYAAEAKVCDKGLARPLLAKLEDIKRQVVQERMGKIHEVLVRLETKLGVTE